MAVVEVVAGELVGHREDDVVDEVLVVRPRPLVPRVMHDGCHRPRPKLERRRRLEGVRTEDVRDQRRRPQILLRVGKAQIRAVGDTPRVCAALDHAVHPRDISHGRPMLLHVRGVAIAIAILQNDAVRGHGLDLAHEVQAALVHERAPVLLVFPRVSGQVQRVAERQLLVLDDQFAETHLQGVTDEVRERQHDRVVVQGQ